MENSLATNYLQFPVKCPKILSIADQNQSVLCYGGGGQDGATLLILNHHTASRREGKKKMHLIQHIL